MGIKILTLASLLLLTACGGAVDAPPGERSPADPIPSPAPTAYEREQDVAISADLVWTGETRLELSCDDGWRLAGGSCATGSAVVDRSASRGDGWMCVSKTRPPFTMGVRVRCER